jgi:hypothetical protein
VVSKRKRSKSAPFDAFRDYLANWGDLSWSYAAVRAPLDDVARELAAITRTTLHRDAAVAKPLKKQVATQASVLAEVKGSPWTVIMYSLGTWVDIAPAARAMATNLDTQILVYEAEDTSGVENLTVYGPGAASKKYATGDDADYEDELLEEAGIAAGPESEIVRSYDEVFTKLDVPMLRMSARSEKNVAVVPESLERVVRAYVLEHASGR